MCVRLRSLWSFSKSVRSLWENPSRRLLILGGLNPQLIVLLIGSTLGWRHTVNISRLPGIHGPFSVFLFLVWGSICFLRSHFYHCVCTVSSLSFPHNSLCLVPVKETVSVAVTYQGILLSTFPYGLTKCQTAHRQTNLVGKLGSLQVNFFSDCSKGKCVIGMKKTWC